MISNSLTFLEELQNMGSLALKKWLHYLGRGEEGRGGVKSNRHSSLEKEYLYAKHVNQGETVPHSSPLKKVSHWFLSIFQLQIVEGDYSFLCLSHLQATV